MPIKARDLGDGFAREAPVDRFAIVDRIFKPVGESSYTLHLLPAGIAFLATRLRASHGETIGELTVKINGNFTNAKHVKGVLSKANHNFSSAQTRSTLSKTLADRSGAPELDWLGYLDEFVFQVLDAERKGAPAVVLADQPVDEDNKEAWSIDGFPILQDHPMVIFGKGSAGKSLLALWIAGNLATQGIPVGYFDWEFSVRDHRRRLERLFPVMPKNLYYVRCDRPMKDEVERLTGLIAEHGIKFVVCDSIVFAIEGNAGDSQEAGTYFRAVRQFKIGSLHLAHTAKAEDETEQTVFGSSFFQNGARSIWFVQRAEQNPPGRLRMGLYHRKSNLGDLLKPRGFEFVFASDGITVEKVAVDSVDELAAKLPMLDRMKKTLERGALLPKAIAEQLGTTVAVVQQVTARHGSVFIRLGPKIGLKEHEVEF